MFARSKAAETLHTVLGILHRRWFTLDDAAHREIEARIQQYGPDVINPATSDEIRPLLSLLESLRAIQEQLPPGVGAALDAAWGAADEFTLRLTSEERRMLQEDMIALVDFRVYRRLREVATPSSGIEALAGHTEEREQPAEASTPEFTRRVTRYANVYFPSALVVTQQRIPLIVHLARERAATSVDASGSDKIRVAIGDMTLVLTAEDFSIEDGIGGRAIPGTDNARSVQVVAAGDSEPVIFFLTPRTAGSKRIIVDIYQNDRNIRSLSFQVRVVTDYPRLGDLHQTALAAVPVESAARADAAPPDLELRVTLLADGKTLSYTLHSPGRAAYNHQPAGQVQFGANPATALAPLLDRLSSMARRQAEARTAAETARAMAELKEIGYNLYDRLFSPELKDQYRRFRETYGGKSLLITTDEPWIPWEIIRPFATDASGAVLYDDPPLCEMFRISRWIAGRGAPDFVAIRHGVWIAPADNLQAAQDESDYFADLHRLQGADLQGPLETFAQVDPRLSDGQTELFHFACHGNFSAETPGESRLKLAGDFLRPNQIVGNRRAGLTQSRPIVFINACHSSRVGAGLTGLDGWALQFIDCGASAFIGSLWEVNDRLAMRFSREFYDCLLGREGRPAVGLGEALHRARMAIKQLDPANPTWLAYVLYGDPYGQAVLDTTAKPNLRVVVHS